MTRLTIGEFAGLTHLSVRTLRRYHDGGLLAPAEVDASSGYRYYAPDQVATAQTIRRLRDLDMPVREIQDLLDGADDVRRRELLARHLERLEQRLEETRGAVAALRRLLGPEEPLPVTRRAAPARRVAAVTATIGLDDVLPWYAEAMTEIDDAVARHGLDPTGPPGALFDTSLFADETGELTVYLPVDGPPARGRVRPWTIPATDLAVTVHAGSHADIDVTYGRLGQWVLDRDLAAPGPVHETYAVGPRDTADAALWRTEVGLPVLSPAGRRPR